MSANTIRVPSLNKNIRSRRPTQKYYGELAGSDGNEMPTTLNLANKLYGAALVDDVSTLKDKTEEYRKKYALTHHTDVVKIGRPVSSVPTRTNVPSVPVTPSRPTPSGLIRLPPINPRSSDSTLAPKSKITIPTANSSTPKSKIETPVVPSFVAPINIKLINKNVTPGKPGKITVTQLQPKYPGGPIPDTSVRTEIGEIPVYDFIATPEDNNRPEVIPDAELIKPFAIRQEIVATLDDQAFLDKFRKTKSKSPGGHTMSELKAILKKLGITTSLSREAIIAEIDSKLNETGINTA